MKKLCSLLLLAAATVLAQGPVSPPIAASRFSGVFVAYNYGQWYAKIYTGTTATGAGTITVYYSTVALPDGRTIVPFSTTAPILVGAGATAETVTPSSVSNCVKNSQVIGSCAITATFANIHGAGELIQSGTFGLEEAVNDAHLAGGGVVMIDSAWTGAGGLNATITGNTGFINAPIVDARGTASAAAFSYKAASNGAAYTVTTVSWY